MRLLFLLLISISCYGQSPMLQNFFMINKDQCYTFKNAEGKTIDSVNTVNGQKYLYKEKVAIDSLISMLKINGTWTKYNAIYTMAGGNRVSCGINYRNPTFNIWLPNYTAYTATQATNYSRKWGIKGDGFNFNINSGIPNSIYTQTNFSFGAYAIKNYRNVATIMSSYNGDYNNFFELINRTEITSGDSSYNHVGAFSNNTSNDIYAASSIDPLVIGKGFVMANRSASNSFKIYYNKIVPTGIATRTTNGGGNGGNIYFFFRNGIGTSTYNNSCYGALFLASSSFTQTQIDADNDSWNIYFDLLGVTRYNYSSYRNTNLVLDGDSQTANTGGLPAWWIPNNTSATGILAALTPQIKTYSNVAVSGTTWGPSSDGTSLLGRQAANVLPLYNGSLLHNTLVAWAGTNDICNGRNAVDIFADIVTYVNAAKATGYKVVIGTVLPRTQPACGAVISGTYETVRLALNNLIRNNTQTYGYEVADVALDQNMGTSATASNNTTYYNADKVHLTVTGATTIFKYFHGAIMNLIY